MNGHLDYLNCHSLVVQILDGQLMVIQTTWMATIGHQGGGSPGMLHLVRAELKVITANWILEI